MVAGSVSPPRLDVANEDLVRAHVQAVWQSHSPGNDYQDDRAAPLA